MGSFGGTKKIGLRFSEKMSGYLATGKEDFEEGERAGKQKNDLLSFEVIIEIDRKSVV